MEEAATRQHAHANTVYHCLYAYYKLGYSKKHLAYIFNKSERTIRNWVNECLSEYWNLPARQSR
ncbi:hypothetical protein L917_06039 [Phytophthora nicotianae]|uniref:Helix-turn-helix domain-containing protein n=2 Tax=Phytophthora nicotianae TaxID=4792 RepID=W2RB02_PHYN3|nr:hypothetical protein PPTG_02459 [Phytophthora nicotianae INRA-310]ETL96482.1 hypothetical protein L917_06039 [Phytophthora nicotianae]ETN22552.1 hypothetical protein PPTG_02459 [Phytophthora nicotianae INRA-310]